MNTTHPPLPPPRRWISYALAGLGLLLVVWLAIRLWPASDGVTVSRRMIQEITVLTPPPPPPPEPEELEEEKPIIEPPTEDPQVQKDVETPSDAPPSDAPAAPSMEAAGLDRAADAGSDSFHLAAGRGGGLFGRGGGGGGGGWGAFVETHIRRALQRDPRTRSAQGFLRVAVNIDPNGRFVDATLRSSTGDAKLDAAIRDVLSNLSPLGRGRPPEVSGATAATINMKRIDG